MILTTKDVKRLLPKRKHIKLVSVTVDGKEIIIEEDDPEEE